MPAQVPKRRHAAGQPPRPAARTARRTRAASTWWSTRRPAGPGRDAVEVSRRADGHRLRAETCQHGGMSGRRALQREHADLHLGASFLRDMTHRLYGPGPDQRESTVDWDTSGGRTTDERRFSVQANHRPTSDLPRPHRGRWPPASALAARRRGLLGRAAAGGDPGGEAAAHLPAGRRRRRSPFDEPVSTTSDLLAPAAEGDPWTIVGSLLDPARAWPDGRGVDLRRRPGVGARRTSIRRRARRGRVDRGRRAHRRRPAGRGPGRRRRRAPTPPCGARTATSGSRPRPEAMGGDHEQWAFDVAAGAGGRAGRRRRERLGRGAGRGCGSAPTARPGRPSTAAPAGPSTPPARSRSRDVASFGDGFVAVGSRRVDGEQDGAVWFSADGETVGAGRRPGARRPRPPGGAPRWSTRATGLVAGGYVDAATAATAVPVSWTLARRPDVGRQRRRRCCRCSRARGAADRRHDGAAR